MVFRTIAAVFLFFSSLSSAVVAQSFSFEPVTRTEQPAPVPSALASVTSFSMNDSGQFAFAADGGLLLSTNGSAAVIAAVGTPAPGGGEFITGSSPSINASGDVVFRGSVTAPSHSGLFLFSNGTITQLLADGRVAPSGDFLVPTVPAMNAAGDVVFVSPSGLFLLSQGGITKIAGRNAAAPGGNTFLTFSSPSINQSGQVVFTATLSGGRRGIFLASGGTISQVARTGTPAPTGGTFFTFLQGASLNDSGQVAFSALVNGAGRSGVFLYSDGQITLPVPNFTSVPGGTLANAQFVSLNNAGQIAFVGQTFQQQPRLGVYLFSNGSVSAVMLPGEVSPEGNSFTQGVSTAISTQGLVAFLGRTDNSLSTIYSFADNQLTRIAGQGDSFPGAARVRSASPFALTDQGQTLLLAGTFPGGTGLFIGSADGDSDPALVIHQSQALPGGGVLFNILNGFTMNNSTQVVFDASSTNLTSQIVLESGGTLSKIALGGIGVGDPAPGGSTFFNFGSPFINDPGQIIFPGATFQGTVPMFSWSNGQLSLFISPAVLSSAVGTAFATVSAPALNDQGQAALFIQPFPFPNGIFLFSQGALTSIARDGDPAPGGGNFVLPFPDPTFGPVINHNGDVAFAADLDTGGPAVFLFSKGTLSRIAGPGDPDPSGNVFLQADTPSINSAGQIAFTGDVNVDGFGTFLSTNGVIVKIARPGARVPGQGRPTVTFADSAKLNNNGQVAFVGGLSTNEVAVFIATPGAGDPDTSAGPAVDPSNHRRASRNGDPDPGATREEDNEPYQGSVPTDESTPSDATPPQAL